MGREQLKYIIYIYKIDKEQTFNNKIKKHSLLKKQNKTKTTNKESWPQIYEIERLWILAENVLKKQ